jgi:hypothetical protein
VPVPQLKPHAIMTPLRQPLYAVTAATVAFNRLRRPVFKGRLGRSQVMTVPTGREPAGSIGFPMIFHGNDK